MDSQRPDALFTSWYGNPGFFYDTQLCSIDRDTTPSDPIGADIPEFTNGYVLDGGLVYSTINIPGGTWWADGAQAQGGDTPSIGLNLQRLVTQHDAWKTFLMYIPPGSDTLAVPLHEMDWKVDSNAALQFGTGGLWTPKPPGTITVTGDKSFDSSPIVWPSWDDIYLGTGG